VFTLDSINMLFISAFRTRLTSLLCLYLVSTYIYAVQTSEGADNLPFLQGMKYADAGRAGIVVIIFFESDCKDTYISHDIEYGVNYESPTPFFSFSLSRVLKDNEQLDISRTGQDSSQPLNWICGNYLGSWLAGTTEGCHNNHGGVVEPATCFRLLPY